MVDESTMQDIEKWLEDVSIHYYVVDFDLLSNNMAKIILSFDNCTDAMMFKLKWG